MEKLQISSDSRILIITPHPDDETYGCGGVLLKYRGQCDVVLLAYGETGNPGWTKDRTLRIRRDEFRTAMEMAGANIVAELGIPNKKVDENLRQISGLDYSKYDYVFVPNRKDIHPDHSCVLGAVKKAKTLRNNAVILQYEMWGGMPAITHYLDISDVMDEKEQLMLCYKSQEERIPYCERVKARDFYRVLETFDKKCRYAELFYLEPAGFVLFKNELKHVSSNMFKRIVLWFR